MVALTNHTRNKNTVKKPCNRTVWKRGVHAYLPANDFRCILVMQKTKKGYTTRGTRHITAVGGTQPRGHTPRASTSPHLISCRYRTYWSSRSLALFGCNLGAEATRGESGQGSGFRV
jgi:hypothetical protein